MRVFWILLMICLCIEIMEEAIEEVASKVPIYGSIFSGFWDNRGVYHFW